MKHLRANGVALAIVCISLVGYLPFAPVRMHDFRAFYCAGKAIVAHADPYREHPLHDCERDTTAPGISVESDDVTVPVPLPGYALAIFALLSRLPFGPCALLWIVASLAAVLLSVELLRRVIGLPPPTIFVAVFLPAAIVEIPLGQLAPFVGCAIALCAYGLRFSRWRLAAAGALATALDPRIALVLCATLVLAVPATRALIFAGCAALALLALVTLGADTNLEYVRAVLHAHAAGNVAERSQFSTTHFAWVAGMGSRAALVAGNLWYACAAVVGVVMALRLRRRFGIGALAVVPPAFAVFGGLYVHFSQLILAVPAFLLLMCKLPSKRSWIPVAIFVLAVPWLALVAFPPFAIALIALAIAYARNIRSAGFGLRLGASSAAFLVLLFIIAIQLVHVPTAVFQTVIEHNPLAELSWSRYVAWRDPAPNLLYLLLQVPTVVAFTACLAALSWSGIRGGAPAPITATAAAGLNLPVKPPIHSV